MYSVRKGMYALFAYSCATSARDTFFLGKGELCFGGQALRIVAPKASERTALEKYRGTDARTIVDGEVFDIKDFCHLFDLCS